MIIGVAITALFELDSPQRLTWLVAAFAFHLGVRARKRISGAAVVKLRSIRDFPATRRVALLTGGTESARMTILVAVGALRMMNPGKTKEILITLGAIRI